MKDKKTQQGISLLIVLLVGTIIMLSSMAVGSFATRMSRSLQARSDAVQALYTAEGVFDCVRYWLNQDYRNFSARVDENWGASTQAYCNGQYINFNGAGSSGNPSYTGSGSNPGIGAFTLDISPLPGTVDVEVERAAHNASLYEGTIRVYSQNVASGNTKGLERFQEYYYYVLYGADVMFVIDRSGSIDDGGDRDDLGNGSEWADMITAVNDTIDTLRQKVPLPQIGLVSFGTDASDTGDDLPGTNLNGCSGYVGCSVNTHWILPDVQLTTDYDDLIDTSGAYDVPQINFDEAATNLSLGISIAGAELMGKYYPHSGSVDPGSVGLDPEAASGAFERIIASDGNFNDLPDQPGGGADRNDVDFPDVIIILTDGAPNGIMTHVPGIWYESSVDVSNNFFSPIAALYDRGSAKLFRTLTTGFGVLVVDEHGLVPNETAGTIDSKEYKTCYDPELGNEQYPSGVPAFTSRGSVDAFLRPAMCNTTLIADKLANDEGIKFITIYVTGNPVYCQPSPPALPPEAQWLRNDIASLTDAGDPLFEAVCDYEDVEETVLELFEKLELQQSR